MRISYIGGGTDYLEYFRNSPGGVMAAAINQYVYTYSHPLSEVSVENFRFTYRESESVNDASHFRHPVVREMLLQLNYTSRINMGTFADLPSGIGLGGSSSFAVSLANLLRGDVQQKSPEDLSRLAIQIERKHLREPGGYQDQYVSAFGNFRSYDFTAEGDVSISEPLLDESEIRYLEERQLLVWVGGTRNSSTQSLVTIDSIRKDPSLLRETYNLYQTAKISLQKANNSPEDKFKVLQDAVKFGWELKQRFSNVDNSSVKHIMQVAKESEIHSFKLCGAGGSGFVLVMADSTLLANFKKKLDGYKFLQPKIDLEGCKTLFED